MVNDGTQTIDRFAVSERLADSNYWADDDTNPTITMTAQLATMGQPIDTIDNPLARVVIVADRDKWNHADLLSSALHLVRQYYVDKTEGTPMAASVMHLTRHQSLEDYYEADLVDGE